MKLNILDVFGNKFKDLFSENEQSTNELLIELATFFYKIDRRVSLEEQQYMENLMADLKWDSPTSVESYQKACVTRVNNIIGASEEDVLSYLTSLMDELTQVGGVEQAKTIAREISDADGEIADDEVRYLDIVLAFC